METGLIDHPHELVVGRVRWFDAKQQCGVLSGVSGAGYFFERTGAEQIARGDVVSFSQAGPDQPSRLATDVRPLVRQATRTVEHAVEEPARSKRFVRAARAGAAAAERSR